MINMYNNNFKDEVDGEDELDAWSYALIKGKKLQAEDSCESETELIVALHQVDGADDLAAAYPSVRGRQLYSVEFWVHADQPCHTRKVLGLPDPIWNTQYRLPLDLSRDCRYLHVEVLRWGLPSESDPGTSDGVRMVGRARIPLPKPLTTKRNLWFGLVRLGSDGAGTRPAGYIELSMSLIQVVDD